MEYLILSVEILLFGALAALLVKEDFKLKVCSIFTLFASLTALYPAGFVLLTGQTLSGHFESTPQDTTRAYASVTAQIYRIQASANRKRINPPHTAPAPRGGFSFCRVCRAPASV